MNNEEQSPALSQAVENMATMREAYDNLSQAAEAYNTGKVQLAANIASKGVEASATETLPELAEKVSTIAQESYTIDGGEMYAKQLFGSLETPNYWNLYEVLANLLSDGRLVQYGGILLAEYYRGYDSFALSGAGAGGAYVVSDKDENGQFKIYTEDTTHTWATEFDGKGNRWVAFCLADEYHDFEITDTNTSPRSIFIGRKVGTITSLVNGRVSQVVVPDGDKLLSFTSNNIQNWGSRIVLRNLELHSGIIINKPIVTESIFASFDDYTDGCLVITNSENTTLSSIIVCANLSNVNNTTQLINGSNSYYLKGLTYVNIVGINELTVNSNFISGINNNNASICLSAKKISGYNKSVFYNIICKKFYFFDLESVPADYGFYIFNNVQCNYVYIGYSDNDKSETITLTSTGSSKIPPTDVELQDGYCKKLNISMFAPSITEDGTTNNITEHILKKLKQDEPDCGDGVTITLGATNLAKLTSAESVQLLDDLTNIYGYTFA